MDRPKLEVADVFPPLRQSLSREAWRVVSMSTQQRRVMTAIEVCRTAALGGHLEKCDQCNHERNCYNSCGDRHCPKCQSLARAQWIEDRQAELLEVPYFHVHVFTVPEEIAAIATTRTSRRFTAFSSRPSSGRNNAQNTFLIAADPKHLERRDWRSSPYCPLLGAELATPPTSALRRSRRRTLA